MMMNKAMVAAGLVASQVGMTTVAAPPTKRVADTFPNWAGFTPEFAAAELPRLITEAEQAVTAIENTSSPSYEDFVWKLGDATRDLWQCWEQVEHMLGVMNSAAWRKLEQEWQPKMVAFLLRVSQSRRLYEFAKKLAAGNRGEDGGEKVADCRPSTADSTRRRILEKIVQGAELAGVGLEGAKKERFNEIQKELARIGADFHNAVIDATAAFAFKKAGKTYTIDDANYPETMRHCADREVREKLYRARVARAPENEPRLVQMLKLRQEEAEILGFGNYAEKSLATKCAPSFAAVMRMIDDLDAATAAKANDEERELLASGQDAASPFAVQPWDQMYLAERLRERKYAYSEEELKRHFELEEVVKGLFRITKFLFGVEIEEVAEKPPVWHADVRFFSVKENGETIAHFYFDPFVRPGFKSGGAWMNEFRNRRDEGRGTRDEGRGTRDEGRGIEVRFIPTLPYSQNVSFARIRSHRAYAREWLRLALTPHPSLIVTSTPTLSAALAALELGRRAGAKVVVDVQDAWPETFERLAPKGLRGLARLAFSPWQRMARRIYREADLVTGVCDAYRDLTGRPDYYRAYLGIENNLPLSAAPIASSNPPPVRLVYSGNLGRTYDLATVVKAVEANADFELEVAGFGNFNCACPRVRFHGMLSASDLQVLFAQCDVGIIPMADESWVGLPNKLFDYSAAGLAIVSSLGGESARLLRKYRCGVTYRSGDAASLAAAIRQAMTFARGVSRTMCTAEFDARAIYDAYVEHVLRLG